ncbi:MAG: serpin family protein [Bacteroidota bacterium]
MSSLLTKLKQLIIRDVLPLRTSEARRVYHSGKSMEWTPATFDELIQLNQAWAESIWPVLAQEQSSILYSPWELLRMLKIVDTLAATKHFPIPFQQWNDLHRILYNHRESPSPVGQKFWYHQELQADSRLNQELSMWMGIDMEKMDFDAEKAIGRANRWLYRSTDELSTDPLEGLSGWCVIAGRVRLIPELTRDYRVRRIPDAKFHPNPGRIISSPMTQILGAASWGENDLGEACCLSMLEGSWECVIWKAKEEDSSSTHWWNSLPAFSEKGLLDLHIPATIPSKTHRFRRLLASTSCADWFDPDRKQLTHAFSPSEVWLEDMLMVSSLEIQSHPRPKRHIAPPEKQWLTNRPFGILIREHQSKFPLMLGWIQSPVSSNE